MTLRTRLFLLFAGLATLLVVAQGFLLARFARAVDADVREVAVDLGQALVTDFRLPAPIVGESDAPTSHRIVIGPRPTVGTGAGAPPRFERKLGDPAGSGDRSSADRSSVDPRAALTTELRMVREEIHWQERTAGAEGDDGTPNVREVEVFVAAPADPEAGSGMARFRFLSAKVPHEDVLVVSGPQGERRLPIASARVAATLDAYSKRLVLGSLGVLAVGLLLAAVVADRLARPLGALANAARRVGEGELGAQVEIEREDEVGQAIRAFNSMSTRLAELDRRHRDLASERQLAELAEVARGLAHSLRNPLNALGLAVDELARGAGEEEGLGERARRQIRRIDGSLRSFLALASAGRAEVEGVALGKLAREVALEAIQDARGRVRVEVAVAREGEIRGVPAELRAVLQALVVNAVEASPDGAVVEIAVAGGGTGDRSEIEVADRGAGIPDAVRPRLFSPHTTTKAHGSGMGLFLARRLAVGRYGGALALVPRDGGGTIARLAVADREVVELATETA